jgi:hypothetical protein
MKAADPAGKAAAAYKRQLDRLAVPVAGKFYIDAAVNYVSAELGRRLGIPPVPISLFTFRNWAVRRKIPSLKNPGKPSRFFWTRLMLDEIVTEMTTGRHHGHGRT